MESMGKKPRRRRSFTPEFKAEIVELCRRGDRSVGQVAKDFDLTETAVRAWVRQSERDAGTRSDGGLTSTERKELAELAGRTAGCGKTSRSSSGPRLSSPRRPGEHLSVRSPESGRPRPNARIWLICR
jgi:transposase